MRILPRLGTGALVQAACLAALIAGCGGGSVGNLDTGLQDLPLGDGLALDLQGDRLPGDEASNEDSGRQDGEAPGEDVPGTEGLRDGQGGENPPSDATPQDPGSDGPPPAGRCTPGERCDDRDPCTVDDLCQDDLSCIGTPVEGCEDDLECTEDRCLSAEDCRHDLKPGWCLVEGTCYREGESDPVLPCHSCVTAIRTDALIPDDSLPCDDGNPCTVQDRCRAGVCLGSPMRCDSGNPCITGTCDQGTCRFENREGPCDDGSLCTENDRCQDGECLGDPLGCFDGNPCTDDRCDPLFGCVYAFNTAACDDGNICTIGDACVQGTCRPGQGRPNCDDGNPCTDDSCVPDHAGGCVHIPNVLPCDDRDPCTVGDRCQGGTCRPGPVGLECDDGNLCTDDRCQPGVGCVFEPNQDPCDDGDPCHLDDRCLGGECRPGPTLLNCDDGNVCTDDTCEDFIGCVPRPNNLPCDDNNVCTMLDRCTAGSCVGQLLPGVCDDGNDCTADFCTPGGGCAHKAMPECRPQIVIDWPARGVTMNTYGALNASGERKICVRGHIEYPMGGLLVPWVTLNGRQCLVSPLDQHFVCPRTMDDGSGVCTRNDDGSLNGYPMTLNQGFNPIVANAEDVSCQMTGTVCFADHLVQSIYYSPKYYPVDAANPDASRVPDGLKMFLGPTVWDDNDTRTPNDIATVLTLLVQNLNIANLIQNPVTSGSFGWCKYRVNIRNVRYGPISVDLVPTWGGLFFKATIPSFRVDIDIPVSGFLCPDFSGRASASSIVIQATVMLSMGADGNPQGSIANPKVTVNGLNVSIDGIWGFLFNWIIDFFEDDFARMIEDEFEKTMANDISRMVADAVKNLALDQNFEIPAFLPGAKSLTLRILAKPSTLEFTPAGGVIGMASTIVTPKGIPWTPLGSIGRASCLGTEEGPLNFPKRGALEIGLHDDFFNLVPYALYWGGGLRLPIEAAALGGGAFDLGSYGISELVLNLDFRLPPILSACNPQGKLMFQAGDIQIDGTMKLFGQPVTMRMFASLNSETVLTVTRNPQTGQNELGFGIREPVFIDIEIASIAGGLVGAEDSLGNLIRNTAIPMLLRALSGSTLVSFPIPEIDLHALAPEMPAGSKIAIDIRELLRIDGNTVVSGNVR